MMTPEEKKAVELLEFSLEAHKCMGSICIDAEDALVLRNLIKYQEKRIRELEE